MLMLAIAGLLLALGVCSALIGWAASAVSGREAEADEDLQER